MWHRASAHFSSVREERNVTVCSVLVFQKQEPQPTPVKPVVKKENQWFDVGIVKVTNMVVTHFYVPTDDSQGDVSVSDGFYFFSPYFYDCTTSERL